jgi:glycosyltransferase involved in cell wall biosynthesis
MNIIEIWGTWPPPVGGVSIHIQRLFTQLLKSDLADQVVLKNFNGQFEDKNRRIYRVTCKLWEFMKLLWNRKRVIHLHSANLSGWLMFLLFGGRHTVILTLHNQKFRTKNNFLVAFINKLFLRRADFIVLNDSSYKIFIANLHQLQIDKIHVISAYIPPQESEKKGMPRQISQFIKTRSFVISANGSMVKMINGRDLYGLDILIETIQELKKEHPQVGLLYLLPQQGDKSYLDVLIRRIKTNGLSENILIYQHQISNGFEVWQNSNLFIRPTQTDIEGISVKEALSFGIPAIASDVCQRPAPCLTYKEGDFKELMEKIKQVMQTPPRIRYDASEAFSQIEKIYHLALQK